MLYFESVPESGQQPTSASQFFRASQTVSQIWVKIKNILLTLLKPAKWEGHKESLSPLIQKAAIAKPIKWMRNCVQVNCITEIKDGKAPGVCMLPSLTCMVLWHTGRPLCVAYYNLSFSRRRNMNSPMLELTVKGFFCLTGKWKIKCRPLHTHIPTAVCFSALTQVWIKMSLGKSSWDTVVFQLYICQTIKPEFSLS